LLPSLGVIAKAGGYWDFRDPDSHHGRPGATGGRTPRGKRAAPRVRLMRWSQPLRVSPDPDGVFFREGEAPAEPRRDGLATTVSTRSPAGAAPRDPGKPTGPACSACGSAGASPSLSVLPFSGRVSGQALTSTNPSHAAQLFLTRHASEVKGCPKAIVFFTMGGNVDGLPSALPPG